MVEAEADRYHGDPTVMALNGLKRTAMSDTGPHSG